MLDTEESAELLRVSKRTIRRKRSLGLLQGFRTHPGNGGKLLFRRADLLALIGIVEEAPPTEPPAPRRGRRRVTA